MKDIDRDDRDRDDRDRDDRDRRENGANGDDRKRMHFITTTIDDLLLTVRHIALDSPPPPEDLDVAE